jgi:hypothetical protein
MLANNVNFELMGVCQPERIIADNLTVHLEQKLFSNAFHTSEIAPAVA